MDGSAYTTGGPRMADTSHIYRELPHPRQATQHVEDVETSIEVENTIEV